MVATKDAKDGKKKGGKGAKDEKNADEAFEPIKVDARAANTAVLMLESPEEEVLQKACEAIFKFCEKSDNNRFSVHQLNATMKLFKLISHEDRVVQRNATMAFGVLSAHPEIRKFLRQENGVCIPKMVTLLTPDFDSLSNEYAALWVRNVSEDYSTKSMIMASEGAIASLVALLSSNDADIGFNALGALDKIMADYQPRQQIRELKGIEPLFTLVKSEYPQIQELAFNCLYKITQDVENREAIREFSGLEKLVDYLGNQEYKEQHSNCLNVLANCLEDTQCLDLIQQTGGLTKILAYCQEVSDAAALPQINATAARALARCARKQENRKILSEQQAEKTLIYLLLTDNDEVKIAAAHAIAVLAESAVSRDIIRNYEGIETLIRLLSVENARIREMACLALSNLTLNNHNNCREILAQQGIEILIRLLKDEKDTTKAYACVCLNNMASDELIRQVIAQNMFVAHVAVALCAKNALTQAKACSALAALSIDSVIRNELRTSGAISTLVQLIQSNNDDVRFNACWAVTCAAADYQIATEFCRYGAIEILRDINQSSKRKGSFTEAALKKLLESNLSSKYALTNTLDATNTINDGFYDMGPMRPNGKFYTIDELVAMPVNDKRPIIIVNSPDETFDMLDEKPQSPLDTKVETSKPKTKSGGKIKDREKLASASNERSDSSKAKRLDTAKKNLADDKASPMLNMDDKMSVASTTVYKPLIDKDLMAYIDEVKDALKLQTPKNQAIALARYVASKLGGPVARSDVANLGYELPINELKYEQKSNVIPIGKIRIGTYYHRALLYKVLADRVNLRVTLNRGDYNRAWNIVALKDDNSRMPPRHYMIDLMHEPGKLMPLESSDAIQYVKL